MNAAGISELSCKVCGVVAEPDLGWQVFANATIHLRADQVVSGLALTFLQYLRQHEDDGAPSPWAKAAPLAPEQPALL